MHENRGKIFEHEMEGAGARAVATTRHRRKNWATTPSSLSRFVKWSDHGVSDDIMGFVFFTFVVSGCGRGVGNERTALLRVEAGTGVSLCRRISDSGDHTSLRGRAMLRPVKERVDGIIVFLI